MQYVLDLYFRVFKSHETIRHCYVHPQNVAVAWELNHADKSYKRPVCEGCFKF